jgi:NTE family protein
MGAYAPGDLNRIVRVISGKATGLVLSAGAARGLAQLGVYRALHEAGIHVDWVGGTSIGAVTAAAIAMDWDPQEALQRMRAAFLKGKPFSGLTVPLMSLLSGERVKNLLTEHFARDIEDLPLAYFCISSNLDRGVQNVHRSGPLVDAIRASSALPGVLPPQVVDNELAVDGAVLNNLPVDVMQAQPVRTIIAVDVSSLSPQSVNYVEIPTPWQVLRGRWWPGAQRHHVPSLAAVMLKATEIGAQLRAQERTQRANLLLQPPVQQYGVTDIKAFDRVVATGYDYAVREIATWLDHKQP